MAKNQTYRAFAARPSHIIDLNGELLDSAPVLIGLASEVRDISAYATYLVRNDECLGDELARVDVSLRAVDGGGGLFHRVDEFSLLDVEEGFVRHGLILSRVGVAVLACVLACLWMGYHSGVWMMVNEPLRL